MKEKLTGAAIMECLNTTIVGRKIIYQSEMPSTMDTARKEVLGGTLEGTVIITDEQTAGKGRIGRPWLSPKGCVALSVILCPEVSLLSSIIMVASLAVLYAIRDITGLNPMIKWPNDIMINDKKVCGILIESGVKEGGKDHTIIGIGINVNLDAVYLGKVSVPATSILNELGREVSRLKLIRNLLIEIDKLYLCVRNEGSLYEEWRQYLDTLGRQVYVKMGEEIFEGVAESVTRDGNLMLRTREGNLKRIIAGDVTIRY
ncbi:MAG: biotin--[acetyl-CoA-carboxylase] ligase [Dehalococcoidia bacterium]|nr:MAG: biotin--[acetyl-CoA-carboxylase] ligase [Dehalococcoidia bacterium]